MFPTRSFIIILFIASLILTGCTKEGGIVIRFWEFPRWRIGDNPDRFFWVKQKIQEFESTHPGVKVQLTELTWDRGHEKIKIAMAAGSGPDVFPGTLPLRYIMKGLIEPVDEFLGPEDRADYLHYALSAFQYMGKTWGWPWYSTGDLLYINLDLFKKRGVSPPAGGMWTFTEFIQRMKRLTWDEDGDGKVDYWGFGFFVSPGSTSCWPIIYADGGRCLSPDLKRYTFSESSGVSGIQRLYDFIHKYKISSPECPGLSDSSLWEAFFKRRRVACAPFGIWAIPALRGRDVGQEKEGLHREEYFPFEVVHFPIGRLGRPVTFIAVSGFFITRQSDSKKKRLCMDFVRLLTNAQAQRDLKYYGTFPTRRSASAIYQDDPVMLRAQQIFENGITVPPHPAWVEIDLLVQREIQNALLGKKGISEALQDAGAEVQVILNRERLPTL
jgi:multiple sugar transport system substrate-binding protein